MSNAAAATIECLNAHPFAVEHVRVPAVELTYDVLEAINAYERAEFGGYDYIFVQFANAPTTYAVFKLQAVSGFVCVGRTTTTKNAAHYITGGKVT
jgi:hypothetical protein